MLRANKKMRVDLLLVERGLAKSRQQAQGLLMAGEVTVDGRLVDKAGALVNSSAEVEIETPPPYVGRGGIKLAHALQAFAFRLIEMGGGSGVAGSETWDHSAAVTLVTNVDR